MGNPITPQLIKDLRELTGVGMAKCKEALEEAQGDLDKAIANLRKAGMASAVKKEGREAKEGLISSGEGKLTLSFIEVNSETDFVSQNEKFKQFISTLASLVADNHPKDVQSFSLLKCKHDPSITVDQYRSLTIQALGENIQIKRLLCWPKDKETSIGIYSHMGGKIVTAIELSGGEGNETLAKDIAMHVAAESPEYLAPKDVPAEIIEREREIGRGQVQGKPAQIIEKIVDGKLDAFYAQFCLLNQKYVKDSAITIAQLLENASKKLGKTIQIKRFLRWQVGE